jgi:hypothetical protein
MTTTTTNPYPHVPLPARAVHTDPWRDDGDGLGAFRFFFQGSVWNLELPDDRHEVVGLQIAGFQHLDGSTERWVSVDAAGSLTSDQARELAAQLIEAADEVDRWSAR